MAKTYRLGRVRRLVNTLATGLLRVGLAGRHTYMLSVTGRRSGDARSTPIVLLEMEGRWLVSPYGQVNWVRNLRAAGWAPLSRGRHRERITVSELGPVESAPILREYLRRAWVCRPFFDVGPDAPLAAFIAEAHLHPVFRIEP
jgi:deazaflavin-dependent oxidoreductase (nitroreductase family)